MEDESPGLQSTASPVLPSAASYLKSRTSTMPTLYSGSAVRALDALRICVMRVPRGNSLSLARHRIKRSEWFQLASDRDRPIQVVRGFFAYQLATWCGSNRGADYGFVCEADCRVEWQIWVVTKSLTHFAFAYYFVVSQVLI